MLSDSTRSPSPNPRAAIRAAIPAELPARTRARIERRACAALRLVFVVYRLEVST
jgi:hypothetical protein